MTRSLVTGGAGFIGSHMAEALVEKGERVRILDDFSTGLLSNLRAVENKIEIVRGSIVHPAIVRKAMKGIDYVFHTAAIRAVERSVDKPEETHAVNVTGTLNILLAAREENVKRVIFSSSSAVYGDVKKFPSKETDWPAPASPYGVSKLVGEQYCRLFSKLYGVDTVSLRYFNVFGPRQNVESKYSLVIPIFMYCLIHGRSSEIHWDGHQSRDFAYIDNIISGNLKARACKRKLLGSVFNISAQEEYSVLDIFNELKRLLNKPSAQAAFKPKRPGDVRRTFSDISKAKRLLGFKVQTRFSEGLQKTAEWFLKPGSLRIITV